MLSDEFDDRRGFLKCMAWAGTGALFAFDGGIGSSIGLDAALAERRSNQLSRWLGHPRYSIPPLRPHDLVEDLKPAWQRNASRKSILLSPDKMKAAIWPRPKVRK